MKCVPNIRGFFENGLREEAAVQTVCALIYLEQNKKESTADCQRYRTHLNMSMISYL